MVDTLASLLANCVAANKHLLRSLCCWLENFSASLYYFMFKRLLGLLAAEELADFKVQQVKLLPGGVQV